MSIIETGALARATEDDTFGREFIRKGTEFVIEDYVSEVDSEDGIPFYWASKPGNMNDVVIAADKVELVKTAAQMNARRIPAAAEIIKELDCLDSYDGFELNEADRPEGNSREISGVTDDGLYFAFTLTVSNVYQGDF